MRMVTVPYKGTSPALVDLVSGRVQTMLDAMATSLPYIRDGRLRALGVADDQPWPGMPDVPPMFAPMALAAPCSCAYPPISAVPIMGTPARPKSSAFPQWSPCAWLISTALTFQLSASCKLTGELGLPPRKGSIRTRCSPLVRRKVLWPRKRRCMAPV